jgi:hypothetical protein
LLEVPTDAARFTNAVHERARLERELTARGIALSPAPEVRAQTA